MKSHIPGQFGVERRRQQVPLPRRHDPAVVEPGQHLDAGPHPLDQGRADEEGVEQGCVVLRRAQGGHVKPDLETIDLSAKGVARDRDVHQPEQRLLAMRVLREEDRARAGAPDQPRAAEVAQRLHQPPAHGQLADGSRLAARDDQAIQPDQVLGQPHLDALGAEPAQHHDVFGKVALQCQYPDPHAFPKQHNRAPWGAPLRTKPR